MYFDFDRRRFSKNFSYEWDIKVKKGLLWGLSFKRKSCKCQINDS